MLLPPEILLATENVAKGIELATILNDRLGASLRVLTLNDLTSRITFPDETGNTFCEIAAVKALTALEATGIPSIGDDSGLCVDALSGGPGVKSRRWTGVDSDDNSRNRALIEALQEYPRFRTAKFVTCAAYAAPDVAVVTASGECSGRITLETRGTNGFGYDPIFEIEGLGLTMAELTGEQKHSISHRGRAIRNLAVKLGWHCP